MKNTSHMWNFVVSVMLLFAATAYWILGWFAPTHVEFLLYIVLTSNFALFSYIVAKLGDK